MRIRSLSLLAPLALALASPAQAQFGSALQFSGGQSLAINNTIGNFGSSDFTIEFFVKSNAGSAGGVVSKRPGCFDASFVDLRYAGGSITSELDNNGFPGAQYQATGSVALNDGTFHHFAAVRQGNTLKNYVDGALVGTSTSSNGATVVISNSTNLLVGYGPCEGYFTGVLDELRLSSTARYTGNFSRPTAPFSPDAATLALYHFDEGTGQTTADASGNGNTATLGASSSAAGDDPTFVTSDVPLPVELSRFAATADARGVALSWTTATERDNVGFTVLRDGRELASFRTTDALRGAGTTAEPRTYRFTDAAVAVGATYRYTLRSTDRTGEVTTYPVAVTVEVPAAAEHDSEQPGEFRLSAASPNPFNPTTTLTLTVPDAATVTATLYNSLGQQIRSLPAGAMTAGSHPLTVQADGLPSGLYLVRVTAVVANGRMFRSAQRMILAK